MSDARDRLDNWLNKDMPVYDEVPDYWMTDVRALIAEHGLAATKLLAVKELAYTPSRNPAAQLDAIRAALHAIAPRTDGETS